MKICAYYSRGPHFVRVLRQLRERFPEAHITALTPPSYPPEPLEGLAHHETTGQAAYGMGDLRALRRLLRTLRAGRYDAFAVMFDSPKLRLLARLSGAKQRYCLTADARFFPMRSSMAGLLLGSLWRNLRGRVTYAYIHYIVHHRPVQPPK